jgi:hypothetical protein
MKIFFLERQRFGEISQKELGQRSYSAGGLRYCSFTEIGNWRRWLLTRISVGIGFLLEATLVV